ncbi:MAG: histone deacetylase family protein [Candidatus Thorarchaeota archaeon]
MTITKATLITHPKSHQHVAPFPRPNLEAFEAPLRLQMADRYLSMHAQTKNMERIKAPRASQEDIMRVHTPYLYESVRLMANLGGGNLGESAQASPDLFRNALVSAGGAIHAAEYSLEHQDTHPFSLMRPPGHHATRSNPGGLCFFNNIAIATAKVKEERAIERISIVDFDDHYGNGTAEIFYADPSVQYISIHEYDYENYGTGHYEELGFGDALGTNINIPLLDGASDTVYKAAFENIIIPALKKYKPEMIAVSAGFDPHYADPVGNMNIDSSTFWDIGKKIRVIAKELDVKGSFTILEGGYNPLATGPSIVAYLLGLLGEEQPILEDQVAREAIEPLDKANLDIIDQVVSIISRFW